MLQKPGIGSGSFGPVGSKGFILYKRSILKIQCPHYSGVIRNVAIDFTLKRHQMFPVHHTPEEIENAAIACHFGIVFEENSILENPTIIADVVIFATSFVCKTFSAYTKKKNRCFKKSRRFDDLFRFLDGLVWTIGLTVGIQMRFQISPAWCGRVIRCHLIVTQEKFNNFCKSIV